MPAAAYGLRAASAFERVPAHVSILAVSGRAAFFPAHAFRSSIIFLANLRCGTVKGTSRTREGPSVRYVACPSRDAERVVDYLLLAESCVSVW